MKKIFFAIAVASMLYGTAFAVLPAFAGSTENWNTSKSSHFIVSFKNAPEKFIEELIDQAEGYYDKIADNLGFTRFNFWLWDNRAKIYIYDNAEDYRASTKQPAWSVGSARVQEKLIYSFPYAQGFFETVLPHELGHIIFREFVGSDNPAYANTAGRRRGFVPRDCTTFHGPAAGQEGSV